MAKRKKKQERGPRGGGTVYWSESEQCWRWRAITGHSSDGSVKYTRGRARTENEAVRKKQDAERNQTQPHENKETVGDHLEHWLSDVAKPNTRPKTWERYEQIVRLHLKPRIGGTPLRKLKVTAVAKLWADMGRDGVSPGNVKKCSEVLATALELAVVENKITVAPTASAVKPRVKQKKVEVFTDEEVKTILEAAAGDSLEALYAVAVGTGARQGELLALELADFDTSAGTVQFTKSLEERKGGFRINPPKSASGTRTVNLPAFAVAAVRSHLANRQPGPAFTSGAGTHISKTNFIRREWKPLLDKANIRYRKFHTMRHTHASRLLAAGVDPAEVAKRIGDKIETLMRVYAHWIPATNRDTAAKINAIYGTPTPPDSK